MNEQHIPLERTGHGQKNQHSLFTTFLAASVLVYGAYKNPYLLPVPDGVIDMVKATFAKSAEPSKVPAKSHPETLVMGETLPSAAYTP